MAGAPFVERCLWQRSQQAVVGRKVGISIGVAAAEKTPEMAKLVMRSPEAFRRACAHISDRRVHVDRGLACCPGNAEGGAVSTEVRSMGRPKARC